MAETARAWMRKEWTPQEGMLACISIQQPFACAIVYGKKTIELRDWGTHYHGPLLLHSGKQFFLERQHGATYAARLAKEVILRLKLPLPYEQPEAYPLGALVGIANLIRCARFTEQGWEERRTEHASTGIWVPTTSGWQFDNVRRFVTPIPLPGQLGLFGVPVAKVQEQIDQAIAVPFTPVPRQDSPEDKNRPMSIADTRRMLGRQRAAGYWPAEMEDIG